MAKLYQNNFVGGVICPSLYARSDLACYYKGAAKAENFVVTKEGSLRKRKGFTTIGQLPTDFANCKIVPYKYDRTQGGYFILYPSSGSLVCEFHGKDGTLKQTLTIGSFAGSAKDIQYKQIGDQVWISNGAFYKIITVTDNATITAKSWSQTPKPPSVNSISSSGYKTNGDNYNPESGRSITYCAHVVKNGVISDRKTTSQTWPTSWSAGYYINVKIKIPDDLYASKDFDYVIVGKKIGSMFGELTRWYPEDFTSQTMTFKDENVSAGEIIYSQTNTLGDNFTNPVCVDCFQQRKVFANATNNLGKLPMTLWFSEVGNIDNFFADRPAADDDAFSPTIMSTGPSFIRFLATYQEQMIAFTDAGLFSFSFAQTQGFSASTCRISRFSDICADPHIPPISTATGMVFVGADQKTVYSCTYDLQDNALKPINRTVLVEHISRKTRIVSLCLQEYPQNVVWVVLEDGTMATFTFERDEEVYAWSTHAIDGARVLDVVSIGCVTDSVTDRTYADLVAVIEKNGVQYIARNNDLNADVIGGTSVPVTATLETLRPEMQDRTIVGVPKNIKDTLVRVFETGGIKVQTANGDLEPVPWPQDNPRSANDLYSGDVKIMPRGYVNDLGQLRIVSDNDRPCEILAIVQKLEMGQ